MNLIVNLNRPAQEKKPCTTRSTPAALLLSTILIWGCSEGYPTDDLVDAQSMTGEAHVMRLNELGRDVAKQMRHQVALAGDCLLRLTSKADSESATPLEIPLIALRVSSKSDAQNQTTTVTVHDLNDQAAVPRAVYESSLWHEAVAFQSHLSQLRSLCVESQIPIEPA